MTISKNLNRITLTAAKGKLITDGGDICGKKVILAVGRDHKEFYEIDESEVAENGISE